MQHVVCSDRQPKEKQAMRILTALFMTPWLIGTVYAQVPPSTPSPESEMLAVEIVTLQLKQVNLDQITLIALQSAAQALRLTDPKQIADLQAAGPVIKDEIAAILPMVAKASAGFFVQNFTYQELVELKAFNASPLGTKLAQKSPEFGAKMGAAMQVTMQQRMPIIVQRVQEELRKKGHQL
jgi:uncharacterized protein